MICCNIFHTWFFVGDKLRAVNIHNTIWWEGGWRTTSNWSPRDPRNKPSFCAPMWSRSAVVQSDHTSANVLRWDIGGGAGTSEAGSVGGAKKKMQGHTTHSTVHKLCVLFYIFRVLYTWGAPEGGIASGEGAFDKQEKKQKNENTDMTRRVTFLLGSQKFLGFCFFSSIQVWGDQVLATCQSTLNRRLGWLLAQSFPIVLRRSFGHSEAPTSHCGLLGGFEFFGPRRDAVLSFEDSVFVVTNCWGETWGGRSCGGWLGAGH